MPESLKTCTQAKRLSGGKLVKIMFVYLTKFLRSNFLMEKHPETQLLPLKNLTLEQV